MDYALLRVGPGRLLVTRPDTNAYGNATLNMATSFQLGRHLGATLCVAPINPERHQALCALECDEVSRWPAGARPAAVALALCGAAARVGLSGRGNPGIVGTLAALGEGGAGTAEERAYFGLDLREAYATRPLPVRLSASALQRIRAGREALGLGENSRLVTLHVRESGYKAAHGSVDREKDAARNASIESYLPAIDWLVSRGYTVVRFGDPLMTPLTHPGVVDLATSSHRTPELEIWAVLESRFFIASDSGPYNLSVLSGVPCLAVNMTHHIGGYPLRAHDRYILKHAVDTETGREVGIAEMFTPAHLKHRWVPGRFRFVDNTAVEIAAAVQEMETVVGGQASVAPAQQAFRDAVVAFLASDYGQRKQGKGAQGAFFLGEGWIGGRFAAALG